MLNFILQLLALLWFVSGNAAQQFGNCDYAQDILAGRQYFIFNPNYPQSYSAGSSCRWVARSDRPLKMTCNPFELPATAQCSQDSFTIFDAPDSVGHRYCGSGTLNYVSRGNQLTIILTTSTSSRGGRFYCTIETVSVDPGTNCRCGWKNPSRIVGGEETGVNEYPMMAGLVDASQGMVYCGATIINEKQVLTAAHCVANRNVSTIGVLVGDHDLTTGTDTNAAQLFRTDLIRIHPQYNANTQDYDIALVTLQGTMTFTQQVGPACLPFQYAVEDSAGSSVQVLGWGSTEFAGPTSQVLMKATLSVISYARCRNSYPEVTPRQMCTSANARDSCQFDSGGPVLWQNPSTRRIVEVGIISLGGVCGLGDAALNTNVRPFLNWILANTTPGFANYCTSE